MRPPKLKWQKTAKAFAATASAVAGVADEVARMRLGELAWLLPPGQRPKIDELVVKMQNSVAELLEHIDSSEECEMD